MSDFSYEIEERIGILGVGTGGWTKELNLISWNGRPAKYDIREWSPDRQKMSKGVSFSTDELKKLSAMLNGLELE